jgi:hypothetical protein
MSTTKTAYVIADSFEGEKVTLPSNFSAQIGEGISSTGDSGGLITTGTATATTIAVPDEMTPSQAPRDLAVTVTHLVFYGEAEPGKKFTTNFSGDANQLTASAAHGLYNGQIVLVESTTTLPAGLFGDNLYYIVNRTATTVELALSPGGTPVTLTSNGTGTHTLIPLTKTGFFPMTDNPQFSNGTTTLIN